MNEHEHLLYEHQQHQFPEKEEYREALRQLHAACQREKYLHGAFDFGFDKNNLTPKDVAGFLKLGDETFTILPKICRPPKGATADAIDPSDAINMRLFLLMLYSLHDIDLPKIDIGDIGSMQDRLLRALIGLFANRLLKELLAGVHHCYVEHEEDLPMLRQRLLVGQQVRHNFVGTRFRCRFDEFTADNRLNRFLLYAVNHFSSVVGHTPTLFQCRRLLQEGGFEAQRIGTPPSMRWSRLNERFRLQFEIACWLLKRLVPIEASNRRTGFLFLFRMYEIFEGFVAKLIKRRLEQEAGLWVKVQPEKRFHNLNLIPDILIEAGDTAQSTRFIIDTKYKQVASTADISQDDKLQMYAYGANFKAEWVMLLYPRHIPEPDGSRPQRLGAFQLGDKGIYGGAEAPIRAHLFDLDPHVGQDELLQMDVKHFEERIIKSNGEFFEDLIKFVE